MGGEPRSSGVKNWPRRSPKTSLQGQWGRPGGRAAHPSPERAWLLTRAIESWAPREPNECGRWLAEWTPGPQLDPAVAAFVRTVRDKDPESARAWAERITDPKIRAAALSAP